MAKRFRKHRKGTELENTSEKLRRLGILPHDATSFNREKLKKMEEMKTHSYRQNFKLLVIKLQNP